MGKNPSVLRSQKMDDTVGEQISPYDIARLFDPFRGGIFLKRLLLDWIGLSWLLKGIKHEAATGGLNPYPIQ